jgi:hypothetical protein
MSPMEWEERSGAHEIQSWLYSMQLLSPSEHLYPEASTLILLAGDGATTEEAAEVVAKWTGFVARTTVAEHCCADK